MLPFGCYLSYHRPAFWADHIMASLYAHTTGMLRPSPNSPVKRSELAHPRYSDAVSKSLRAAGFPAAPAAG